VNCGLPLYPYHALGRMLSATTLRGSSMNFSARRRPQAPPAMPAMPAMLTTRGRRDMPAAPPAQRQDAIGERSILA
jgi:hypothetical protein